MKVNEVKNTDVQKGQLLDEKSIYFQFIKGQSKFWQKYSSR